jgi:hypothetical protein
MKTSLFLLTVLEVQEQNASICMASNEELMADSGRKVEHAEQREDRCERDQGRGQTCFITIRPCKKQIRSQEN